MQCCVMTQQRGNNYLFPLCYFLSGLKGGRIEPLVPLLTFIGNMELDKSIEKISNNNESFLENNVAHKKKKGLNR